MTDKQQRRQDHFNKAYLGVIAQGEPAVRYKKGVASCMYLSPTGSKCNVGHLLSEEMLKKYGDVIGPVNDLYRAMYKSGDEEGYTFLKSDENFYAYLQEVHDNLMSYSGEEFVDNFKHDMGCFARSYGLTVPDETATA